MLIFPAIDLVGGKAVRLYKGDYAQMTVYDDDPLNTARKFEAAGARYIHMVDLEGAFKSVARSLRQAVAIDPSLNGEIPSTKGVL